MQRWITTIISIALLALTMVCTTVNHAGMTAEEACRVEHCR